MHHIIKAFENGKAIGYVTNIYGQTSSHIDHALVFNSEILAKKTILNFASRGKLHFNIDHLMNTTYNPVIVKLSVKKAST